MTGMSGLVPALLKRTNRDIHCYADARQLAQRRLPWMIFDYIDGAAGIACIYRLLHRARACVRCLLSLLQPWLLVRVLRAGGTKLLATSYCVHRHHEVAHCAHLNTIAGSEVRPQVHLLQRQSLQHTALHCTALRRTATYAMTHSVLCVVCRVSCVPSPGEGTGERRNREAIRDICLQPRVLNNVEHRSLSVNVFGRSYVPPSYPSFIFLLRVAPYVPCPYCPLSNVCSAPCH